MMKKIYKNILTVFTALSLLGLGSCTDDKLFENGSDGMTDDNNQGALEFTLALGAFDGSSTRATGWEDVMFGTGEEEDNKINPENFHIILFDKNGGYLKEWTDLDLRKIETVQEDGSRKYRWKIRIPYAELKEPFDEEILDENGNITGYVPRSIMDKISKETFKIAVLANWEQYPDFVSKTSKDRYDENGLDKNNIFYMTHCIEDKSYEDEDDDESDYKPSDVYGFITGNKPKMALWQDWINEKTYDKEEDADFSIRHNYTVESFNENGELIKGYFTGPITKLQYYDAWKIWNFGGEKNKLINDLYNAPNTDKDKDGKTVLDNWAEINNDWYKSVFCIQNGETEDLWGPQNQDDESYPNSQFILKTTTHRGLTLVVNDPTKSNGAKRKHDNIDYYGINLRSITSAPTKVNEDINISTTSGNYFKFKIPADGTVKVICENINPNSDNIYLVGRKGPLDKINNSQVRTFAQKLNKGELNEIIFNWKNENDTTIRVSHNPQDFCLYAAGGNMRIYQIEYIKDRIIYLADRQGISPLETSGGGISMYGIQDFDAIGDYWPEGTVFNLSSSSSNTAPNAGLYQYRTISLLRSVAKCEVLLPKRLFPKPSHMIMRTMNRYSRSAPLDVFTPTDILWNGYPYDSRQSVEAQINYEKGNNGQYSGLSGKYWHNYASIKGVDNEYLQIKQNGPTFKRYAEGVKKEVKLQDYQDVMSWLYGIWYTEYGWRWGDKDNTVINFNEYGNTNYPRIFNARIARTDYAHFIEGKPTQNSAGEDCYYYYIYIPEKNITDPNNRGSLDERLKLQHIEMRFEGRNGDANMDDNACYRLYFAEGGKIKSLPQRGGTTNGYDYFEDKNKVQESEIKQLYPIMRNHVYRFEVTGISMNEMNVKFDVINPENREVNYIFE